jgi:chorismate mutase / prephenate dehydratase
MDNSQLIEKLFHHIKETVDQGKGLLEESDRLSLQEVLKRYAADSGLPEESIDAFSVELASLISRYHDITRVAFLGPDGTFSHMALTSYFGTGVTALHQSTIPEVFRAVERGEARYGIVPVENSTEGSVTYTMDELTETTLQITGESYEKVTIAIHSREESLESVTKIFSHPQPLAQCRAWIRSHLGAVEIEETDSTTAAAQLAVSTPGSASLGAEHLGHVYNLHTLARHLEDSRENSTRFIIIGKEPRPVTGNDKTSLVFAMRDRPGALLDILSPLQEKGINMTRIESRPNKKKMWAYNFFIDIRGHRDDERVKEVMEIIKPHTVFMKILGSYPSSGEIISGN